MFNQFFFVIRHGLLLDRIHPVDTPEITIGRSERNTLRLPHEAVSRSHALIERSERGFLIRDLRSRNGTQVNQCVVESRLLQEFDVVRIAPFSLKVFLNRERAEADAVAEEDAPDESTQSFDFEPNPAEVREELKRRLIPSLHRVYDGLMDGHSEKDIVRLSGLCKNTVHCYVGRIYDALGVHSHSELMAQCQRGR
jgi:hypothetical protein